MRDFIVQQKNGKCRIVTNAPEWREKPSVKALAREINPMVEPHLGPNVHGWRKRHSTATAAAHINSLEGDRVAMDIVNFYGTVDQERLRKMLDRLDPTVWPRLARWLPDEGLPAGCHFSPALANLYLTDIDRRFPYVRYADNLLVVCHDAERVAIKVRRHLSDIGLLTHELIPNPTRFCGEEIATVTP